MFSILKRAPREDPAGYILRSADGWYLSLTQRVNNACRITTQRDALQVAEALTGRGEMGRWEVLPGPPLHSDPMDPRSNPYKNEGWLSDWLSRRRQMTPKS